MSWGRILLYYGVAILLAVHLRGVWAERSQADAAATTPSSPFVEAVPERIDRVRMDIGDLSVQFDRTDDRWVVSQPENVSSPSDIVDAVVDSLTSIAPIEIVADGLEHEGQYGLMPPRARLRLEQQGEVVAVVVLGELNPTRTAVYAKKSGKDEVVLLGLNAKYYMDLVFENVRRQLASGGVAAVAAPAVPHADGAAEPPVAPARAGDE